MAEFLGIVPARGGSKRIPGKNLARLNGVSLLEHTIRAGRACPRLKAVMVSTDSADIAAQAAALGAIVPGLRPAELALDATPTALAVRHALQAWEALHDAVDAIVILQPTSPFRTAVHIGEAIERFERQGADTVTGVRACTEHPYWTWRIQDAELVPYFSPREIQMDRAQLPPAVVENGAVYVVRRALVLEGRLYGERTLPYEMDALSSIDIDTPLDLAWAEFLLQRGLVRTQAA